MRKWQLTLLVFAMLVVARHANAGLISFQCAPAVCQVETAGDGYYASVSDYGTCSFIVYGSYFTVWSQADIGVASNCYSIVAVNIVGGVHYYTPPQAFSNVPNGVYTREDALAFDPFTLAEIGEASFFEYWDCPIGGYIQFPVQTGGGTYPC